MKNKLFASSKKLIICAILMSSMLGGCVKSSDTQTFAWPLATASPENTVTQIYAEEFAKEVEELSDGRMKIEVFPNSTLGGDRDLLESCADGDIPFVVQNTAPQVTFMKDLAVFDLPCLFQSIDQLRERIDDPNFSTKVEDVYTSGGYYLLGIADQGFRVMSTNKKVASLNDFKSQKIRTMENPYHLAFWQGLGSSPTPMTFSEVYIGLQQHTIDAQENPYEVIVSNRLYEQQDYIVETNHLPHLITLIVNDKFYQNLSEEDRQIMDEAARRATEVARQKSDERIAEKIAEIENSGSEILEVSPELNKEIQEASKGVYDRISSAIDPEIYKAYTDGILN